MMSDNIDACCAGLLISASNCSVMSTKKKKAPPTGIRYSDAQKKEVVDFVIEYNSANGRGGQSAAAKKFKITPLTISAWIKASGSTACQDSDEAKLRKLPRL